MFWLNETCASVQEAIILEISEPAAGYFRLALAAPLVAAAARPGQFALFYLPAEQRLNLPRPLSLFNADEETGQVAILFQKKGIGTAYLASRRKGDRIKLLGPLGTGFPPLQDKALLVAGGIGIAPLSFLAGSALKRSTLIYGARSAGDFCCSAADLKRAGLTLIEVTEDGSFGLRGNALEAMKPYLNDAAALYACGPRPLLAALQKEAQKVGVKSYFSLEEQMACGVGACVGCVVKTVSGYRRVCHDGPVFAGEEVVFDG